MNKTLYNLYSKKADKLGRTRGLHHVGVFDKIEDLENRKQQLTASNPEMVFEHVNKHVVKMIVEYGQLMSTAHRVLDGTPYLDKTKNNRNIQRWLLHDDREQVIWKASHIKHPSGLWLRSSSSHYEWLYSLWLEMLKEYTYRYGKIHSTERMKPWFSKLPTNIPIREWLCDPTPAMPDQYKVTGNSILSYRNYYIGDKRSFAAWKNRATPGWFV